MLGCRWWMDDGWLLLVDCRRLVVGYCSLVDCRVVVSCWWFNDGSVVDCWLLVEYVSQWLSVGGHWVLLVVIGGWLVVVGWLLVVTR